MSLSNYLLKRLIILFSLIIFVWALTFFFYNYRDFLQGIDNNISELKDEFVANANQSPNFINEIENVFTPTMVVTVTDSATHANFVEHIYTDRSYFTSSDHTSEIRRIETSFHCTRNNQYYILNLASAHVNTFDFKLKAIISIFALFLTLSILTYFGAKMTIKKAMRPLYQIIADTQAYQLGQNFQLSPSAPKIVELDELSEAVNKLLRSNSNAYNQQKHFIENTTHELQTPIAAVIAKLELIINDEQLAPKHAKELAAALSMLNYLKRLNSSLALLSKIENQQFQAAAQINFRDLIQATLDNFAELLAFKTISTEISEHAPFFLAINEDLAQILLNNLLKNAINHNFDGGSIAIEISPSAITITNTGANASSEHQNIFARYQSSNASASSMGLGLAIVRAICETHKLAIAYNFAQPNLHSITISKS